MDSAAKAGTFIYSYSAKEQEEVKNIRRKYVSWEESDMEKIRRLDKNAEWPGMAAGILTGTAGTLALGGGIILVTVLSMVIPGILVGLVGLTGIGAAYPLYSLVTRRQRKKLAPKILELADILQGFETHSKAIR